MKAQQAPGSGSCGDARQAWPSLPDHTAPKRKKRSNGGSAQPIKRKLTRVSAILPGDENRFSRSQPNSPARSAGGGRRSVGARRKYAFSIIAAIASAFLDRDRIAVEIHEERRDQANEQIDRHGDGDYFDGLAGEVEHAAGKHLHEIGVTDGDGKRGILD